MIADINIHIYDRGDLWKATSCCRYFTGHLDKCIAQVDGKPTVRTSKLNGENHISIEYQFRLHI